MWNFRVLLMSTAALALGACQAAPDSGYRTPKLNLPSMQQPEVREGARWHALKDGREAYEVRTVSLEDGTATYRNNRGCEWRAKAWGFAPASAWRNCAPFADGAQLVTRLDGAIWPLELGKEVRYEVSGSGTDGRSWSGIRRCRVQDEVRLKTVSGDHDTYKVVCYDPWTIRIWYVSPKLEESVHQVRYRKWSRELTKWEMTD